MIYLKGLLIWQINHFFIMNYDNNNRNPKRQAAIIPAAVKRPFLVLPRKAYSVGYQVSDNEPVNERLSFKSSPGQACSPPAPSGLSEIDGGVHVMEGKREPLKIREIRRVVEANIGDEAFNVSKLCRLVCMSRSSLHRILKHHTRKSTVQFICSIRLKKAKELLAKSDLNIKEISFEVGFGDPKYFSRVFFAKFNQSPRSFRKSILE